MRAKIPGASAPMADAKDYQLVFEMGTSGPLVLLDLMNRFCQGTYVRGGIDAARETDFRCGKRAVVEFIQAQIDKANNPETIEPLEGE